MNSRKSSKKMEILDRFRCAGETVQGEERRGGGAEGGGWDAHLRTCEAHLASLADQKVGRDPPLHIADIVVVTYSFPQPRA